LLVQCRSPGVSEKTSFNAFKTEDFFRDHDQTTSIIHMCKSGFVTFLDDDNKLSATMGKQVLDVLEEDFNALLKFSTKKYFLQVLLMPLYIF
jgi:hypothetical protein